MLSNSLSQRTRKEGTMDTKPVCKSLSKRWFKFYSEPWLLGDIRELTIIERAVLVDLLCMASFDYGEVRYSSEKLLAKKLMYPSKPFESAMLSLAKKKEIFIQADGDKKLCSIAGWNEHQADSLKKALKSVPKSDTDSPPRGDQSRPDEIDKISAEQKQSEKTDSGQSRVSASLRADTLGNPNPNLGGSRTPESTDRSHLGEDPHRARIYPPPRDGRLTGNGSYRGNQYRQAQSSEEDHDE
jgi:hypothetical protein